eukprot:CAMPEP_0176490878 /NCGR_PEP_ID=MMETSP0200_2-20121128/8118_1 /TAXON_ID=947934 /ORGANISM="Chaetoceros sp., Strain GSL56" /LENGTH=329 /DNA_ID=CAMNT_0017888239 /DNA_START=270 /DNA_END=1255 /DNA_ORIENTATION=+
MMMLVLAAYSSVVDPHHRSNENTEMKYHRQFPLADFPLLLRGGSGSSSSNKNHHHYAATMRLPNKQQQQQQQQQQGRNDNYEHESRCWIQRAIQSRQLALFSHRSFANYSYSCKNTNHQKLQQEQQQESNNFLGVSVQNLPLSSCKESFYQLKSIGVNHFDIDLILHDLTQQSEQLIVQHRQLLVAHPMEYKKMSNCYSPCSNVKLDDFLTLVKQVYNDNDKDGRGHDFFISMEPKAAWKQTLQELQDPALTNIPLDILQSMLDVIRKHDLKRHQCAVIVDDHKPVAFEEGANERKKQKDLLQKILYHCQHFIGLRITDGPFLEELATS